jgi:hypothetical protein
MDAVAVALMGALAALLAGSGSVIAIRRMREAYRWRNAQRRRGITKAEERLERLEEQRKADSARATAADDLIAAPEPEFLGNQVASGQ